MLQDYNDMKHADPYLLNKSLRAQLRKIKKDDADLDSRCVTPLVPRGDALSAKKRTTLIWTAGV